MAPYPKEHTSTEEDRTSAGNQRPLPIVSLDEGGLRSVGLTPLQWGASLYGGGPRRFSYAPRVHVHLVRPDRQHIWKPLPSSGVSTTPLGTTWTGGGSSGATCA